MRRQQKWAQTMPDTSLGLSIFFLNLNICLLIFILPFFILRVPAAMPAAAAMPAPAPAAAMPAPAPATAVPAAATAAVGA